jgi:hypothetical protein
LPQHGLERGLGGRSVPALALGCDQVVGRAQPELVFLLTERLFAELGRWFEEE